MKRLAGLSALALIISSTSGCGWVWGPEGYFRDRGSDYLEAQQTAPMQLPPNVSTSKRLDPLLPIPRNVADDTAKGEYIVPRPQPLSAVADASDYSLQKSGDSRWIVAQRPPAEVWPVAVQFFQDNGFRIAEQRPQTGEFTTAWQQGSELSATMAKRLQAGGVAADSEARVRVRIEPGVQRNTSEIYVVSAERPAGSTADVAFTNRSVNTGLDAALVDDMLASMSRTSEKGGSVSMLSVNLAKFGISTSFVDATHPEAFAAAFRFVTGRAPATTSPLHITPEAAVSLSGKVSGFTAGGPVIKNRTFFFVSFFVFIG